MVSYSRAEGISGVVSSENDDADAIISVEEIIGSDQVMHDWNRNRVAPEFREFKPVSGQNSGAVWCGPYCFARLSLTMATGPSNETRMCCHPCAL
jgi:hypothetical protein